MNEPQINLPLIIAHRGASAVAPENTLAAFHAAVRSGADGIELDARLSLDGVPVVIHDPSLKRTGRRRGRVSDMTAAELSETDVSSWFFDRRGALAGTVELVQEGVPTLASVLDLLSGYRGRIYIELKGKDRDLEALVRAVCRTLDDLPMEAEILVKSFKLSAIPMVSRFRPGTKTAALFAPKVIGVLRKEKHLVAIADELGANEISVHYSLATKQLMKQATKLGLPVAVWTVDKTRWLERARHLGVKALITNDPVRLIAERGRQPAR